jgi:hypothetical protein
MHHAPTGDNGSVGAIRRIAPTVDDDFIGAQSIAPLQTIIYAVGVIS